VLAQGGYYLATGLWPLFSRRTFEAVTGPKHDFWLVQTFGLLVGVVGAVLCRGDADPNGRLDRRRLAAGSALALGAADVAFVMRGRISRVYLVDAALEAAFLAWLARDWHRQRG
jgi:hypothetical protein